MKRQSAVFSGLAVILTILVCNGSYPQEGPESADGHFQKALEYEHSGKLEEAKKEYQEGIALDPKLINGFFNLGILYGRQGQWQNAADSFEHVIQLDPNDAQAHFRLAYVYNTLRRPLKALTHYDKSQELGYQGNPLLGQLLQPYRDKEVRIEYSSLDNPAKKITLRIQGNSIGTDTLMRDAVKNLQLVDKNLQKGLVELIRVQFVNWENENTWVENWTVKANEAEHTYPIHFVRSPDGGTDLQIGF